MPGVQALHEYVKYRSHFGSRYNMGCCGHAGLFCILGGSIPHRTNTLCYGHCCPDHCQAIQSTGARRQSKSNTAKGKEIHRSNGHRNNDEARGKAKGRQGKSTDPTPLSDNQRKCKAQTEKRAKERQRQSKGKGKQKAAKQASVNDKRPQSKHRSMIKSRQHPKVFPGGPPPQY